MELNWIGEIILIFFGGAFILRIAGRKSISQMTTSQTVIMIGLGSLLIQPLIEKSPIRTLLSAFFLITVMVITEYMEIKFNFIENILIGKAVIVIENGIINFQNLKKIRLSVDMLEKRLRQLGIASIKDVKYATVEVSGELGYELKEENKPVTKGDIQKLINEIEELKRYIPRDFILRGGNGGNIFAEIKTKRLDDDDN